MYGKGIDGNNRRQDDNGREVMELKAHSTRQCRPWLQGTLVAVVLVTAALRVNAEPATELVDSAPAHFGRVDLVQASQIARTELGGEIIRAELTRYRGVDVYRVRLLDQGRVRDALVDAATGIMLSPDPNEESE